MGTATKQNERTRRVLHSTGKDDWRTPADVLAYILAEITPELHVDAAATAATAVAPHYFGPDHHNPRLRDALTVPWRAALPLALLHRGEPVAYCNPPYSRKACGIEAWTQAMWRASRDGITVIGLFYARTETVAWHRDVSRAAQVWFVRGRLHFRRHDGQDAGPAPAPNVLVVWRPVHAGPPQYGNLDLRPWRQ